MNNNSTMKKTPQLGVGRKSTSEKKLVQARLPFKVISSSTEIASPSPECRKRKLSYSSEEIISTPKQTKLLTRSKENLDSIETKSIVLVVDDESSELDEDNKINTTTTKVDEQAILNNLPSQTSSSKRNKLTIKLPLSSKKKRKKCKYLSYQKLDSESSDPEIVTDEIIRLKKTKISDDISNVLEIPGTAISNNVGETLEMKQNIDSKKDIKDNHIDEDKVKMLKTCNTELRILNEKNVKDTSHNAVNKTTNQDEEIVLLEISDDEKVEHKKNENDTKSISPIKQNSSETIKLTSFMSPIPLSTENNAISPSPSTIKNLSPNLKKKNDINKLEIERQNKKEDQKRNEKEEQRRKEKEEKEELKRKEKQEKDDLKRKEKEEKEDLKRKEKEEKEELKRKEKEEKEKKRLAELEMKNEEKRQKDDEKRKREEQKEEERRKRDDEKRKKDLEKEEAENKKRKAAEAFTKFFRPKKSESKINIDEDQSSKYSCNSEYRAFMPFQVKGDMKLAPLIRKKLNADSKDNLDEIISDNGELPVQELYLNLLRDGKYLPYKLEKTENDRDDLIIIDEFNGIGQSINEASKSEKSYKAKYFNFQENRRPPYYGTWRKKSTFIGPRRPFSQDKIYFEYEVDSDDEWEEEEPGESLHGSDDEKESEDEYEVDNEFFVPHGHLSDEEMQNEDETDQDNSPECQKAKLKILQLEFAKEMKKKTEKIRPRLIGIVWADENGNQPDTCPNAIWESLNKRAMILCSSGPLIIEPDNICLEAGSPTLKDKKLTKRNELPVELVVELIRLVHGNRHKKKFLINEFQAFIAEKFKSQENPVEYSKAVIRENIDKVAKWMVVEDKEKMNKKKKLCWMVSSESLLMHSLENISCRNTWKYILSPVSKYINSNEIAHDNKTVHQNNNSKDLTDIKIFTKVMPKDEIFPPLIHQNNDTKGSTDINSTKMMHKDKTCLSVIPQNTESKVSTDINITKLMHKDEISPAVITNQNNTIISDLAKNTIVKKRVPLLISVPRGQAIPETYKNELITSFLSKNKEKVTANTKSISEKTNNQHPGDADCLLID